MTEPNPIDYSALAKGVEQMRECVNSLVAGLKSDGFTDREARIIVASLFSHDIKED